MRFPDAADVDRLVDPVRFPQLRGVRYDPPTRTCEDPTDAARTAVEALPLGDVPVGGTVGIGVGSRGIDNLQAMVSAVVEAIEGRDREPLIIPAMGSHGGATAAGQRRTLAELGITPQSVGARIDASMNTSIIGTAGGVQIHLSDTAADVDGLLVVNRIKPHTNFAGPIESGLSKMVAIGLGKQAGASAIHRRALRDGYLDAILEAFAAIREVTPLLGGVAIVENFHDETALVDGIPVSSLPDAEAELLDVAREELPTLPFEELDVLVVDRIGKDVSGTGMDTNVVGRNEVLNATAIEAPPIKRIFVRGLTDATGGNANGIGTADVTTQSVLEAIDFRETYANALTSNAIRRVRLPLALPDDERALRVALASCGPYDPESVRLAWIRDTGHLARFAVSPRLAEVAAGIDHLNVESSTEIRVEDGAISAPGLPIGPAGSQ